jgi:hypothetical protein
MNVYVESNFVLEYALVQEQYESCDQIMSLAESGQVRLVVPAFSIAETSETLYRRRRERLELGYAVKRQLDLLARTQEHRDQALAFTGSLDRMFTNSTQVDVDRLQQAFERILAIGTVVPLTANVLTSTFDFINRLKFKLTDAAVLASVVDHLSSTTPDNCCFLNRDAGDFQQPRVKEVLAQWNCTLLISFDSGRDYIVSQLRT